MAHTEDPIVPDDKNWTWVLERACPECGFDTRDVRLDDVSALLQRMGSAWRDVLLGRPDVTARPVPATWSPLEYGCHVRDAFRVFDERLRLMLSEDEPRFANWDQDRTAVEERYAEQKAAAVADELVAAAEGIARRFAAVQPHEWSRTGLRSDGSVFTVETLARYLLHDPVHHLYDVTGVRAEAQR
jgi:hypothetical protein